GAPATVSECLPLRPSEEGTKALARPPRHQGPCRGGGGAQVRSDQGFGARGTPPAGGMAVRLWNGIVPQAEGVRGLFREIYRAAAMGADSSRLRAAAPRAASLRRSSSRRNALAQAGSSAARRPSRN